MSEWDDVAFALGMLLLVGLAILVIFTFLNFMGMIVGGRP